VTITSQQILWAKIPQDEQFHNWKSHTNPATGVVQVKPPTCNTPISVEKPRMKKKKEKKQIYTTLKTHITDISFSESWEQAFDGVGSWWISSLVHGLTRMEL